MSPVDAAVLVAAIGVVLSASTSLIICGIAWGKLRANVDYLMTTRSDLASKTQVDALTKDLAEIKGMFRVTLSPDHGGMA